MIKTMSDQLDINSNTLDINENYRSFGEFYFLNKYKIYKSLVNIFQQLVDTKKENIEFIMKTNISNEPFVSKTSYNLKSKDILEVTFLPYFEKLEDYETCFQIKKILDVITKY